MMVSNCRLSGLLLLRISLLRFIVLNSSLDDDIKDHLSDVKSTRAIVLKPAIESSHSVLNTTPSGPEVTSSIMSYIF